MSTFLFDSIVFGPVWSRRLGESLGVNLLPTRRKTCNFNCIYCECGLTPGLVSDAGFPPRSAVAACLRQKLQEIRDERGYIDCITFAGNGEPTLHPEFPGIMSDTLQLRDELYPGCRIAVLSNATMTGDKAIFDALMKADLAVLKLDSAIETTIRRINCPLGSYDFHLIRENLLRFRGKLIIQSLFFEGMLNGMPVSNITDEEIKAWLAILKEIRPESVMVYSIARDTAVSGLQSVDNQILERIAQQVRQLGINAQVNA